MPLPGTPPTAAEPRTAQPGQSLEVVGAGPDDPPAITAGRAPATGPSRRLGAVCRLEPRPVDVLPATPRLPDEAEAEVAWLGHAVHKPRGYANHHTSGPSEIGWRRGRRHPGVIVTDVGGVPLYTSGSLQIRRAPATAPAYRLRVNRPTIEWRQLGAAATPRPARAYALPFPVAPTAPALWASPPPCRERRFRSDGAPVPSLPDRVSPRPDRDSGR